MATSHCQGVHLWRTDSRARMHPISCVEYVAALESALIDATGDTDAVAQLKASLVGEQEAPLALPAAVLEGPLGRLKVIVDGFLSGDTPRPEMAKTGVCSSCYKSPPSPKHGRWCMECLEQFYDSISSPLPDKYH